MQTNTRNLDALASTARWTAAIRAQECKQAEPLFDDPWAAALAGQEGFEWLERVTTDYHIDLQAILIRTRFFDDFVLKRTAQNHIRQVVLVAAGMDTRGFRLPWPEETRLFELDLPQVLETKDQILASAQARPTCWRQALGVDLEGPWIDALLAARFDSNQPSIWVLEGILGHLTEASALRLLDEVTRLAAPGSWLSFEATGRESLGGADHFATNEPEALLTERGWTPTVLQIGEEGANFGRWPYPVLPRSTPGEHGFFITAQRLNERASTAQAGSEPASTTRHA